ncbi:hypothetical protein NQ315_006501 [Exocentrus adspersus]|uniref:Ku domain-containing protein n=1 Tax=Exocentrus adspersus TaxID=1586481 RepID=A0AAV8W1N1_9CUCU|nr:hypothetical protein NQ315_006501 [Exocentrus adspersus]
MPPPSKKDVGVIIFDVNASNKEEALASLMQIYTHIWLSSTKDLYRVILANTKESRNNKQYKNVYDGNINDPDPQSVLSVVEQAEAEEGDWLEPLLLAVYHLKQASELPGVITLQVLYLTKLDGSSQKVDMTKVEQLINDLREYNIYLYIAGPEVKLPFTITDKADVKEAMENAVVDESKPALVTAKRIVDATDHSVICDLKVGTNLFFSYRNSRGTQPWKVPLSFGSALEIPACTVKILRMDAPFKLSTNAPSSRMVLCDDEKVTVDRTEVVSGIARHGKFVKVDERDMFKVEGPRCFSVLGFTEKKNIPEYYMREGAYCVLPDASKPNDCSQAFYNLVDVLAEQKKYAVVRRVYNSNNKPKFFVLVPQPESEPKSFVMSELPYADDLKQTLKFSDPVITEDAVDEDFEKFFNSIDIWEDSCKLDVPLGPKMIVDLYLSKLANAAASKYLGREFKCQATDVVNMEDKDTNESLQAVRRAWPRPFYYQPPNRTQSNA